jgi:Tol biopolymer transport system component
MSPLKRHTSVRRRSIIASGALALAMHGCGGDGGGFRGELVGSGVISTDARGETFPMVSADGATLYFSRVKDGQGWPNQIVVVSEMRGGSWSEPTVMAFSGTEYSDRAPRLSHNEHTLFFTSNRPLPGGTFDPADYNIWQVWRMAEGAWSDPEPLPADINSPSSEIHSSATEDGTLYFASARPGGAGRSDLYRAAFNDGAYAPAENLGSPLNTAESQPDVYVAPDGSFLILAITDHPDGFGGDDLYVSHLREGVWTTPVNLGAAVNTTQYEYGPVIQGGYLYFTSHQGGTADIYRVRLRALPQLND